MYLNLPINGINSHEGILDHELSRSWSGIWSRVDCEGLMDGFDPGCFVGRHRIVLCRLLLIYPFSSMFMGLYVVFMSVVIE